MKSYEERTKDNAYIIAMFQVKQKQDYEFKVRYAEIRAREFYNQAMSKGYNVHVSVGGLDSITLFLFLRSIGLDVPGISVSGLEDISIQRIHKSLGIERLRSAKREDGTYWRKKDILQEFGFPVLSKEIAAKIEILQNPSPKNATVRHAIITGETGEYGGNRTGTRMQLSKKWLEKFGGYENENEGVNYSIPEILVSSKCCYYLKEKPCDDWATLHHSVPYLGLMASEGGRRERSLMLNGCNYWGKSTTRSAPFAIFNRQDILRLALDMDAWYQEHWKDFGTQRLDTVIPEIYGTIEKNEHGELHTTKAQRTGCSMCGFGIQLEKRPHRFDMLYERNPKEWDFWMNRCVKDSDGNFYGWGKVLDYIGVNWTQESLADDLEKQEKRKKTKSKNCIQMTLNDVLHRGGSNE